MCSRPAIGCYLPSTTKARPRLRRRFLLGLAARTFRPAFNGYVTESGAATYDAAADVFTLTPSAPGKIGAVMSNDRIDMTQDFTLTFSAFLGSQDSGGHGIAFVLHNDASGGDAFGSGPNAQGALGIANGLAISIDTYRNPGDPTADHTNFFDTDGALPAPAPHHSDAGDISVKPRKLAMARCDGFLGCRNADIDLLD